MWTEAAYSRNLKKLHVSLSPYFARFFICLSFSLYKRVVFKEAILKTYFDIFLSFRKFCCSSSGITPVTSFPSIPPLFFCKKKIIFLQEPSLNFSSACYFSAKASISSQASLVILSLPLTLCILENVCLYHKNPVFFVCFCGLHSVSFYVRFSFISELRSHPFICSSFCFL